jgi:hypothetical protein
MENRSAFLLLGALCFFSLPARAESDSLFVILGGYNSCYENNGSDPWPYHTIVWDKFESTIAPAVEDASGVEPEFLTGCYGVTAPKPLDYYLNFRFLSSCNPSVLDLLTTPFFGSSSYQNYSAVVDNVVETVEAAVSTLSDPKIYLIGHSYGGWTTLQSALRLVDQGQPVRGVFTIDPISPIGCSPLQYVKNLPLTPPGCLQAPADFTSEMRIRLRDQLDGRWINFYETQHLGLHSSRIPELEDGAEDFHFSIPSIAPILANQHSGLAKDARVWKLIKNEVLSE